MTNQIKPTHSSLDAEEARLLYLLLQARRYGTGYDQTRKNIALRFIALRFIAIDKLRSALLGRQK